MENIIINWLFQTNAIQVCHEDQPFWYTSGTLGPYYVNTHYLYGSKNEAENLLSAIDECSRIKELCPIQLFSLINQQYKSNNIFHSVIDLIVEKCKAINYDFISGGERRDFFFSIMAANILKKPHLSIFKDGDMVLSDFGFATSKIMKKGDLKALRALHIADLVTEASSYTRAWIPAIESLDATISDTMAVVYRNQGGKEILEHKGVLLHSFATIQKDLFDTAKTNGYINEKQYEMILDFIESPAKFMTSFIKSHPDYLSQQIEAGGKSKERALLFMEKGFHKQ